MSKTKKEMQDAMLVVLQNLKTFKVDEAEFDRNQPFYDKQKEKIQNMACELSALINVFVK
jgi:hypothetical protein